MTQPMHRPRAIAMRCRARHPETDERCGLAVGHAPPHRLACFLCGTTDDGHGGPKGLGPVAQGVCYNCFMDPSYDRPIRINLDVGRGGPWGR